MDLLKEKIPILVRKLALPAMVGMLFQTLYNIVDTFYAGRISPEALAALTSTSYEAFVKSKSRLNLAISPSFFNRDSNLKNLILDKNRDNRTNSTNWR